MKRISETVSTNNSSSAFTVTVGATQQNDLILAVASIANSSTFTVAGSDTFVTAGFTLKGTGGSGPRLYFYWKLAGASEPTTFSAQTSSFAAANVAILVYRGVDLASTIDSAAAVFTAIASTTTKTHAAPQITTTGDERLVISAALINTNQIIPDLTKVTPLVYASQSGRLMVAKQWQESAGTSPAFNWESNQTSAQTGVMGCLAIINASGASRAIGCTSTHRRLAKFNLYGTDDTFAAPSALHSSGQLDSTRTLDTVASKYTSGVPALTGVYRTGPTINNNSSTGLPKQVGFALDFSASPLDLTDALIGASWSVGSSQWNTTVAGTYGLVLSFSDGTNVEHFQVRAAATAYLSTNQLSFISLGSTTPDWNNGAVNYASIAYIGWTYDRASGAGTNLPSVSLDSLFAYDGVATLVGGGSDNAIDAEQIYNHLVGYIAATGDVGLLPAARFQGNSQLVTAIPVQLGDGSTPTYIDLSLKSLDTPRVTTRLDDYDCAAGLSGITLYPSANCTVRLGSVLAGAVSRQYLNFHASAVIPSEFVAAGATISGRDVAWLTDLPCPAMSFDACYSVDMKNADCTGTVWRNPQDPVTADFAAASFTEDGAVLTGTETDVSGTSADYHLTLGTSVTAITLTDHTFTGTAALDKIHVLATTGTVTITISGTTSLVADDVTSEGADVDIAAPELYQSATITGFRSGSMIQLYDVDYTFDVSGSPPSTYPSAGDTYTDDTYGYVYTVISAGSGAIHTYGRSSAKTTGTLTRTSGSGDASIDFIGCADNGTELFRGSASSGDTVISGSSCVWTDSTPAAAKRYIRYRRGYVTASDADIWEEKIIGVCDITEGAESISYLDAPEQDATYVTNGKDGPTALASGNYTFTDTSPDLVTLDATGLGGTASWKTLYAVFQAWLSSSSGISDDFAMMTAIDTATYRATNTRIKVPLGEALQMTEGYCTDAVTGLSITLWDSTGGSIAFAGDGGYAYSSGSGLSPEQAAELTAAAATIAANLDATVSSRAAPADVPSANDVAQEVVNGITF